MNFEILPSALADLEVGFEFYEQQERGIGWDYLDELFRCIRGIESSAGTHRVMQGFHRCLASKFHAAIYYKIDDDTVLVHRILDLRRDPQWLRRQLKP